MKKLASKLGLTPNRVWIAIFALWVAFLTGMLGTPGISQMARVKSLLEQRQTMAADVESEIARLEEEIGRLEKSRVAQEREIRRTLGYAASDEIIFDFSSAAR